MRKAVFNLLAVTMPLLTHAEASRPFAAPAAVNTVTPSGVGSLGQVTVALGLVLAVIFGAAWLLRRMRGFGKPAGTALDVVADLPLGQKERAVLVRCGSIQLLLGVAPGQVTTLHTFAAEECPLPSLPGETGEGKGGGSPDFKAILKRSFGL